jgi:hypothetical protein
MHGTSYHEQLERLIVCLTRKLGLDDATVALVGVYNPPQTGEHIAFSVAADTSFAHMLSGAFGFIHPGQVWIEINFPHEYHAILLRPSFGARKSQRTRRASRWDWIASMVQKEPPWGNNGAESVLHNGSGFMLHA